MRIDSAPTPYAVPDAPVDSAAAKRGAPTGPRQAAAGAPAAADIDRAAYVDTVNRWFVAAMLGRARRGAVPPAAD